MLFPKRRQLFKSPRLPPHLLVPETSQVTTEKSGRSEISVLALSLFLVFDHYIFYLTLCYVLALLSICSLTLSSSLTFLSQFVSLSLSPSPPSLISPALDLPTCNKLLNILSMVHVPSCQIRSSSCGFFSFLSFEVLQNNNILSPNVI